MKSEVSSINMTTGTYITKNRPHTLVQINDNSGVEISDIVTFGYSATQVIYSPKGITNKFICIEGDDVLSKYDKLFGKGNTNLYGPMATYARRFLESGFNLNVLNVAPPDARHANTYCAFVIKPAMTTGATPVPKMSKMYVHYDEVEDYYTFAKTDEDLPETGETKIVNYPDIKFGFESRYITDVDHVYDPEEFLAVDDVKVKLPVDRDVTKLDINIPVFGLFYEGATDYGNNFKFEISDTAVLVNNRYPLFKGSILDKEEKEFEFNFTLFNVKHEMVSTSLKDNVNKTCRMNFTSKNALQIFRPYLVNRKTANQAKGLVTEATKMLAEYFLTAVKTHFPSFDPEMSSSNVMEFVGPTLDYALYYQTQNTEAGRTLETPFSYTTPWTELETSDTLLSHSTISKVLNLEGGSSGKLKDILDESEFDWNIRYDDSDEQPIFIKMFMDAYSGKTDRSLFDQALVKDSLLVGDSYPVEIQTVMEELCRNQLDVVYCDKTRPDFSFFRTPQLSVKDFQGILKWYETMKHIPNMRNTNCKPIVGRGMFEDPTTGGQNEFELLYDWFGESGSLAAWLKSGTGDSFASDSWSDITSIVAGTEKLIPDDEQRESLSTKDINYFTKKSDKTLTLGEDTSLYMGYLSILKNMGTTLHFNRILNICTLIARDNPIIDPTEENINKIKRKMLEAAKIPAKHFGNTLTIDAFISTHDMEKNKNVVVYNISVEKGIYSRQNRVVVNANLPASAGN
ncbi:MAG: hypothetical protein ACRCX2_17960 [Paraclostridium sp.]